jgi:PAS domain S-box-containing protein
VAPDFAELVDGRIQRILQQGKAAFESAHMHKDGTSIPVEVHSSVLHAGGEALIVSVVRDLSEREQAQADLRRSEEQYRQLFESMQDVFYRTDEEGKVLIVSPSVEAVFGYTPAEVVGKDLAETFYYEPADRPSFLALLKKQGQLRNHRTRCKNHDGEEVWVSTNARFYEDLEGRVLGVEGITRDITTQVAAEAELKRTLETLQRSNKDLEQFAYVASHDLQEPLRMITSYLQLLDRRYKGKMDSAADEFIDFAVDGAGRMRRLIDALLVYSRVGRSGEPMEPVNCDVVLDKALENLRRVVHERDAVITHDGLPEVAAMESQLVQLLQNLISNAIKFCDKEPPKIHVSVRQENGQWVFSVKDNGLGLDPQFAERIFGVFQRLHKRDAYPGTGVGLAICKRIVQRHGGRIWVESEQGEGATFLFTIPAV